MRIIPIIAMVNVTHPLGRVFGAIHVLYEILIRMLEFRSFSLLHVSMLRHPRLHPLRYETFHHCLVYMVAKEVEGY